MASALVRLCMLGVLVAGCSSGGNSGPVAGGGGGAPSPAPQPAPIVIFQAPATQEFAVAGSALRIRYDAATNRYDVLVPGRDWAQLVDDPQSQPAAGSPETSFVFQSTGGTNHSYFMIRASHRFQGQHQYHYSNLAAWGLAPWPQIGAGGVVAFGTPTAASAVPRTGSATYQGMLEGLSTVDWSYEGAPTKGLVAGSVQMSFDFGAGVLSGQIQARHETSSATDLPVLTFRNTNFGVGSPTFSGQFATDLPGANSFDGRFTGPNAEELIGGFVFPFVHTDGSTQSAQGAWIAKR